MQAEVLRRYDEVVRKVRGYHPSPDLALFDRAFRFAVAKHEGQQRKSGDPYVIHPVEVAGITADLQLDIYSLCAALLHDTVEDTNATLDEVEAEFGDQVAFLVGGLTKLSKLEFKSREEAQAENVRKLIVAMSRDVRVVLVKLADRLHNLRTLDHMSDEGRARIATETLDIYAPLANRLGINWMKVELEDTSFRHLNPAAYADVVAHVSKSKTEREEYIRDTISLLKSLTRKQGLSAEIQGRPKHYYSIFRKLKKSGIEFEQLHDVTAFRVIVENKSQCYETLGIVHDVWKPVPNRFKDYIAIPKANGYQSLHTTGASRSRFGPRRCTASPSMVSRRTGPTKRGGACCARSRRPSPGCATSSSPMSRLRTRRSSSTR
jgi:GTP pyrophosphokinase